MRRLVIGVSGASGMPLARVLLRHLAAQPDLEIHLVVSEAADRVLRAECGDDGTQLRRYASMTYAPLDMAAPPASGSWLHDGMIVCPCSMRSLAAIATGVGSNLLHRAADVTLKERRPLLLVVRETPFNRVHLRNMDLAAAAGATIMPFIPACYTAATTLDDMMRQFSGRLLDQLRLSHTLCERWGEAGAECDPEAASPARTPVMS